MLVLEAIEAYLVKQTSLASAVAWVVQYIGTLPNPGVICEQVDEEWIKKFRAWVGAIPVVSPAGKERPRALSTVEGSVIGLAAAMRHVDVRPKFKPIPTTQLNRTPSFRATVEDLAAMFRYALTPNKRRGNLLAFLRVSVVTLARPDAAHDASCDPRFGQWEPRYNVFNLNPRGRRPTKKVRAIVPIARQAVWMFAEADGHLVAGVAKKSFTAMALELGLPGDGQSGMKLIRRSMANIIRGRLEEREKPMDQLEVFLGHRVMGSVSELYAPFSPSYLRLVKGIVEEIIDEIETLAPRAFHRTFTANASGEMSPKGGIV
jgi:hypothetical protein